jgi:hypothetical protein
MFITALFTRTQQGYPPRKSRNTIVVQSYTELSIKKKLTSWHWWHIVIPATQEAEIRRIKV